MSGSISAVCKAHVGLIYAAWNSVMWIDYTCLWRSHLSWRNSPNCICLHDEVVSTSDMKGRQETETTMFLWLFGCRARGGRDSSQWVAVKYKSSLTFTVHSVDPPPIHAQCSLSKGAGPWVTKLKFALVSSLISVTFTLSRVNTIVLSRLISP